MALADRPPTVTLKSCEQCGERFDPRTDAQLYCSRPCRWDHANGVDPSVSRARRQTGYGWPCVHPTEPRIMRVPRRKKLEDVFPLTAVCLPDTQIGYWIDIDGVSHPMHDPVAIDVALQIVEFVRPDISVVLGDFLDFPAFGRYRQEPGFQRTTQAAIDYGGSLLDALHAVSGAVWLFEGNHDARLHYALIDNVKAAAGLTRANATPDEWPVLTVPDLLRLEERGTRYVGGYPAGAAYLNDNLAIIHGRKTGNATRNAAQMVVEDERVSVIHGHTHKAATAYRTRNTRDEAKFTFAHSPGCLCRIDGAVPGTVSAVDLRGRPVRHWQDWQQGVTVVSFEPGDGRCALEHVPIEEGRAWYRGRLFEASPDV